MKTELTQDQRNAIHQMIRLRLRRIDSIPILLDRGEPESAQREWKDCHALIALLDELGWAAQDPGPMFTVELPDTQFARAFDLVADESLSILELGAEERLSARAHGEAPALAALRVTRRIQSAG